MKCHTCRPEGAPSFLCAFRNGKPLPRGHEVSNVVQNETRQRLKGPTHMQKVNCGNVFQEMRLSSLSANSPDERNRTRPAFQTLVV